MKNLQRDAKKSGTHIPVAQHLSGFIEPCNSAIFGMPDGNGSIIFLGDSD